MREKRTASLTVRMLPSVKELLKTSAQGAGVTVSEFIENMIQDYCSNSKNEK